MTSLWAPVLAASVAVAGTLAAAIFTQIFASKKDERRRAEERAEKRALLEREDHLRLVNERRTTFVKYLKSLHDGSEGIRAVVLDEGTSSALKVTAVGAAFRDAGIYAAREELILVATEGLAEAARAAFYKARDLRDLAASGVLTHHSTYQEALIAYRSSLSELRAEMRRDLGVSALPEWRKIGYDL